MASMDPEEAALIADHSIASGHEIPGVEAGDADGLADYVLAAVGGSGNIEGPRFGGRGREAYWDWERRVIIVRDPNAPSRGTAFQPSRGYDYFLREFTGG